MPPAYSPTAELAKPMGRKPAAVTSVPVSIGNAVDSQAKDAARTRSQPCSIFTTIISTAMMASSTRRPSAMISAPSVMRCRSIDIAFMTMKTMARTSGTDIATTITELQNVGALGGDDTDAERGLAFLASDEGRGIDETMRDGGDIAEPEHAAVA